MRESHPLKKELKKMPKRILLMAGDGKGRQWKFSQRVCVLSSRPTGQSCSWIVVRCSPFYHDLIVS